MPSAALPGGAESYSIYNIICKKITVKFKGELYQEIKPASTDAWYDLSACMCTDRCTTGA